MENQSLRSIVKELLSTKPETRIDDNILAMEVWKVQDKSLNNIFKLFGRFEQKFINGELASFSSISKYRRQLQHKYPLLRDNNYDERQKCANKGM